MSLGRADLWFDLSPNMASSTGAFPFNLDLRLVVLSHASEGRAKIEGMDGS